MVAFQHSLGINKRDDVVRTSERYGSADDDLPLGTKLGRAY